MQWNYLTLKAEDILSAIAGRKFGDQNNSQMTSSLSV
jgi:hypothetical protein